jgi:DNA-binding GntR family transcriptional regulator
LLVQFERDQTMTDRRRERGISTRAASAPVAEAKLPVSGPASEPPAHERVYRTLRQRILTGGFLPGRSVTLRGIALQLGVSPMPVREAVRRLIAERALDMHDNRRVSVPAMTAEKFNQILFARRSLEPELAARALPHCGPAEAEALETIDHGIDTCMANGDTEGYMRLNHQFHFTMYRLAHADMLLSLTESTWLQFGPFMRMVYGRFGTATLVDQHVLAIAAVRAKDETALRKAITEDIMQGMRFIGEAALRQE